MTEIETQEALEKIGEQYQKDWVFL
jgi:hypothetical protein